MSTTWWLVLGILATVLVHEGAHAAMAKHLGWTLKGAGISKNKMLIGVKCSTEDPAIAKTAYLVALAGPAANVFFADFLLMLGGPIAHTLFVFNLIVVIINLIPMPGTDGSLILRGLREQLS